MKPQPIRAAARPDTVLPDQENDDNMVTFSNSPTSLQETLICSRKECRATAHWQILWNNPRIHEPERRKIWLACNEHQSWLEDYLAIRRLWKETKPLTGLSATAEER